MVRVVNGGPGISIMRPGPLGNVFKIGRDGTRDEVVDKHRAWLWEVLWQNPDSDVARAFAPLVAQHMRSEEVRLVCCCKPERCHGDNVRDFIVWFAERGGYQCR